MNRFMTHCRGGRLLSSMTLSLSLVLFLSVPVMADSYTQLLQSAQAQFRAHKDDAARTDVTKARQLAGTPGEQIEADLLLAQILMRQKQSDAAMESYQAVLSRKDADEVAQAKARMGIAGILVSQQKLAQARQMLEPVLALPVAATYKNNAQRDLLRTWWGQGSWGVMGDVPALQKAVDAILAQQPEAWSGQHLHALQDAANLLRGSRAYAKARDYYQQILAMDDSSPKTNIATLRLIAGTYVSEGQFAKAREALAQALQVDGIAAAERAGVLQEIALTYSSIDQYEAARKQFNEALALKDLPDAARAAVLIDLSNTYLAQFNLTKSADIVERLLDIKSAPSGAVARHVTLLATKALALKDNDLAEKLYTRLVTLELSPAEQRAANSQLAEIRLAKNDWEGARQALANLLKEDSTTPAQDLADKLKLAGSYGAANQPQQMHKGIDEAMADHQDLPAVEKIRALWDAGKMLFDARQYQPARQMMEQADHFAQQGVKTYDVQAVDRAPVDVGAWQSSGLLDAPGVTDSRFYAYSQQDAAALLAVDVRADRPFGEASSNGPGPGKTQLAMVYDTRGWHIYVHSAEPLIDQIMARNGQGASSLEMFFTPGLVNEPYYQWIVNLGTEEVSTYDWSSPHRHYRTLQSRDDFFKVESKALADGWGTAIFISWEAFYDQMPMLEGKPQVWRFSMERWDPSGSVTWGGRVHETGRWGHIIFNPPSLAQRSAIQRQLVKKAHWHEQAVLKQQATFWSGNRGDQAFYQQVIVPLVKASASDDKLMKDIDKWNDATLDKAFQQHVCDWEQIQYTIDEQRQAYLRDRLLSPR